MVCVYYCFFLSVSLKCFFICVYIETDSLNAIIVMENPINEYFIMFFLANVCNVFSVFSSL